MELKATAQFVANGFQRWSAARGEKTRAAVLINFAGEKAQAGFLGKIRLWFKTELAAWQAQKAGEKSSPKILW